jgi:hypothetical protein
MQAWGSCDARWSIGERKIRDGLILVVFTVLAKGSLKDVQRDELNGSLPLSADQWPCDRTTAVDVARNDGHRPMPLIRKGPR